MTRTECLEAWQKYYSRLDLAERSPACDRHITRLRHDLTLVAQGKHRIGANGTPWNLRRCWGMALGVHQFIKWTLTGPNLRSNMERRAGGYAKIPWARGSGTPSRLPDM